MILYCKSTIQPGGHGYISKLPWAMVVLAWICFLDMSIGTSYAYIALSLLAH